MTVPWGGRSKRFHEVSRVPKFPTIFCEVIMAVRGGAKKVSVGRVILANNNATKRIAPGVTLVPHLGRLKCRVSCVKSCSKVRGGLVRRVGVPCCKVSSKGLEHCFSLGGFASPFHMLGKFNRTGGLLGRLGPSIIFSGNNFIAIPIMVTTNQHGVPAVVRRSSVAPKLTGGVYVPSTAGMYYGFPRAMGDLPTSGTMLANAPVHRRLLGKDGRTTHRFYNFASSGPILVIVNKDLNTTSIGRGVHGVLPRLLGRFRIVRLYNGKGVSRDLGSAGKCMRCRCVGRRLTSLFTLTSVIVSHTNTGTVYRLGTLGGPGLLVPLSTGTDHNSRVLGTHSFRHRKFDVMLRRRRVARDALLGTVHRLCRGERSCIRTVSRDDRVGSVRGVAKLVRSYMGGRWSPNCFLVFPNGPTSHPRSSIVRVVFYSVVVSNGRAH